MYQLQDLQTDSAPPKPRAVLVGFAAIIGLSLLGVAGVLIVGLYLPATATKSYWFISRSSGLVAYSLVTLGVLWGLIQSGGLFRTRFSPVLALGLHSFLNWMGLGFAALHGLILLGDGYIHIDLPRVFTPFLSEYRPVPVGLGIISFYLMLLLSLSFYARSLLGQRAFRLLHYVSFAVFVMVTAHGIYAGSDSGTLWWMYAASIVFVAGLTVARIVSTRAAGARGQPQVRHPHFASLPAKRIVAAAR